MNEEVGLVKIVAEAEVKTAERHGAAVPPTNASDRASLAERWFTAAGHGMIATPVIRTAGRGGIVADAFFFQANVNGGLPLVKFRLKCSCS